MGSGAGASEALCQARVNVHQYVFDAVAVRPFWVHPLELSNIADPPDMVADPVVVAVAVLHGAACQALYDRDSLSH